MFRQGRAAAAEALLVNIARGSVPNNQREAAKFFERFGWPSDPDPLDPDVLLEGDVDAPEPAFEDVVRSFDLPPDAPLLVARDLRRRVENLEHEQSRLAARLRALEGDQS